MSHTSGSFPHLAALGAFLLGAAFAGPTPLASAQAKLTHNEALRRSAQVSDVRYDLAMDISHGDKEFTGDETIDFEWQTSVDPLRIDFYRGTIKDLKVNGKPAKYTFEKDHIAVLLKADLFHVGPNSIAITYSHPYSKDGSGLYRFVDPEDKRTYLYSNFEPYDANQMFPAFDQPDLKGKFTVTVTAPKDWTVVSAIRESKVDAQKDKKIWHFPQTVPISTYLFSIAAGPYKVWEDTKFRIPLRVMARQSMASFVKAEEWLTWTRYGFDFFEKTFGTPYPFLKYDQILVPDFNAGAMENVATVTFNERFAPRGERSAHTMESNFDTLLHEMAHMWFGDLVTMKWWDDLWLNESFATYAAAWALSVHPDFKHEWVTFHHEKNWGYSTDRLSTTHPIVAEVPDTDVAGSNFDGITYGKGASWLKLLAFRVGEKDFTKGLQSYFKTFAFKNSTVDNLLGALEQSSGLKLQEFAKPWLHTAGLNTVEMRPICTKDGMLDAVEILQTAPIDHPDLRLHSMVFALYGEPGSADVWQPYKLLKTDYEGAKTILKLSEGLACPQLIIPNASDDDYVKIIWPQDQLLRVQTDLARIADPLQRTLFWESLGWALEDGEAHLEDVVRFTVDQLPLEKDYAVLGSIGQFIHARILSPLSSIPDRDLRVRLAKQLAVPFQKMLIDTKTAKDFRLLAFDFYIELLGLSEDRDALAQIYEKKTVWPEFKLDQPRRWSVLGELAALRDSRTLAWAKSEKDHSDQAALERRGIEASLAPYAEKVKIAADILKPTSRLSRAQVLATFGNLFPVQQATERQNYRDQYLKNLPQVVKIDREFIRKSYLLTLLSENCDASDEQLFAALFKLDVPASISQDFLERRDEMKICRTVFTNVKSGDSKKAI
ncbi:MAG: aminopeptidase N [Chitinophagaceae bacterium]|nr:aminopeptidase N [Oligoflexus sp.]